MSAFAEINDVIALWRKLKPEEVERAESLLDVVSDSLRMEAKKRGKDLDKMIETDEALSTVAKSVTVDVVARTLLTSTENEPMIQSSESAMG